MKAVRHYYSAVGLAQFYRERLQQETRHDSYGLWNLKRRKHCIKQHKDMLYIARVLRINAFERATIDPPLGAGVR